MQIKIFTLPVSSVATSEAELNHFLRSHKIFNFDKEFVENKANSFWTIWIQYEEYDGQNEIDNLGKQKIKSKIDYKEKLAPEIFEIFAKLREIRKQIAINDGVAIYVVFTNSELESIALLDEITLEKVKAIKGIGSKRLEKYAAPLVEIYNKEK